MKGENHIWNEEIRLHDLDLIAAAQILAWIARPHRPQSGVHLLEQWFWSRRHFREEMVPSLPYGLDKRGRITAQLAQFNKDVLAGFRAGIWFDRRVWAALPTGGVVLTGLRGMGRSTRQLAKSYASRNGLEPSNAIRDIWSKRKPVVHLASAAVEVLGARYADESRQGFDLERTLFWPNWVSETISRAEEKAESAARHNLFPLSDFHRFHRDKI